MYGGRQTAHVSSSKCVLFVAFLSISLNLTREHVYRRPSRISCSFLWDTEVLGAFIVHHRCRCRPCEPFWLVLVKVCLSSPPVYISKGWCVLKEIC